MRTAFWPSIRMGACGGGLAVFQVGGGGATQIVQARSIVLVGARKLSARPIDRDRRPSEPFPGAGHWAVAAAHPDSPGPRRGHPPGHRRRPHGCHALPYRGGKSWQPSRWPWSGDRIWNGCNVSRPGWPTSPPRLPEIDRIAGGLAQAAESGRTEQAPLGRIAPDGGGHYRAAARTPHPGQRRWHGAARQSGGHGIAWARISAAVLRHPLLRGAIDKALSTGEPQAADLFFAAPVPREIHATGDADGCGSVSRPSTASVDCWSTIRGNEPWSGCAPISWRTPATSFVLRWQA